VAERIEQALVVLVDGHEEAVRAGEVGRLRAELVCDLHDRPVDRGGRADRVALEVIDRGAGDARTGGSARQ
jgi:hypothetical protein